MRCALPFATIAAARLLRLLLALALLLGPAHWSAAPSLAAAGNTVPHVATADQASQAVVPRDAALQAERAAKKDPFAGASADAVLVATDPGVHGASAWSKLRPIRAPPSAGLPALRPEPRAPPLLD